MLLKTKLAILFSYLTDSWRKLGFILFQQRFWESECNRLIKISTRIVHFNLRADMCYTRRKYFSFLIFLLILSILFYSFSFIFFSFSFLVFPVTFFSLFSFPFLQIFFHYLRPFLYLPLIDFLFPPRSHLLILFLPPFYPTTTTRTAFSPIYRFSQRQQTSSHYIAVKIHAGLHILTHPKKQD